MGSPPTTGSKGGQFFQNQKRLTSFHERRRMAWLPVTVLLKPDQSTQPAFFFPRRNKREFPPEIYLE
jgi:hypothetical protein